MRQSMTVIEDSKRWRELVGEYGRLDRGEGVTRQRRGQLFNGLIAELLKLYGIKARADNRSVGELDVIFTYNDRRFILEAKWVESKTDTGPIAKLQRRVEQRMAGVAGVFLSMSGYTADAIDEYRLGRRIDTLLLERSHWEAILSGLMSPQDLFDRLLDAAQFEGTAHVSLLNLLKPEAPISDYKIERVADSSNLTIKAMRSPATGATTDQAGNVYLTTDDGIILADLGKRRAAMAAPVQGCTGPTAIGADGSIIFMRQNGIGAFRDGHIEVISDGVDIHGTGLLVQDHQGAVCVNLGVTPDSAPSFSLVRPDSRVGTVEWKQFPEQVKNVTAASALTKDLFAVGSTAGLHVLNIDGGVRHGPIPLSKESAAILALDGNVVLALDASNGLWGIELPRGMPRLLRSIEPEGYVFTTFAGLINGKVIIVRQAANAQRGYDISILKLAESDIRDLMGSAPPSLPAQEFLALPPISLPAERRPAKASQVEPNKPPVGEESSIPSASLVKPPSTHVESRPNADKERGYQEASVVADFMPLYLFDELASHHFDVPRWIAKYRHEWHLVVSGEAPGFVVAEWLPRAAHYLGSYAAPSSVVESHFTPTPGYLLGFSAGLRAAWDAAIARKLVPADLQARRQWMQTPLYESKVLHRLVTMPQLREAASRHRRSVVWRWIGRTVLWLATAFFLCGTTVFFLIVIGVSSSDSVSAPAGGLAFFGIPFAGLLTLVIRDARRSARRRKERLGNHPKLKG